MSERKEKTAGAGSAIGGENRATNHSTDRIDRDEIIRAARLLIASGGITELRALDATMNGSKWTGTISGYFDSPAKLADAVASITSAKGIYIVPNEVSRELLARASNRIRTVNKSDPLTADHDIARRRWLLIDVDAQRPAGISANDDERKAAYAKVEAIVRYLLIEKGWPDPIVADSGNGYHLLYRIDASADDGGLVQRCLAALAARFNDDRVKVDTSVFNPARIWKLYGTRACKGDSTPDRPHRMARMLEVPATVELVTEAMVLDLGGAAEAQSNQSSKPAESPSAGAFDLPAWIVQHFPDATGPEPWKGGGQIWELPTCPYNPDHKESAYIGRQPSGPIVAGCHHDSCTWDWHELRARFDPAKQRGRASWECADGESEPIIARSKAAQAAPEPWRPFPTVVIPDPVGTFIVHSAAAMQCDESFVALSVLSALAATIGATRRVELHPGWHEPCILWTATIGESGTLKTPAIRKAVKPLREIQAKALAEHGERMMLHEIEKAQYDRDYAAWKRSKTGGEPPAEPVPPTPARVLVADVTVEGLAPILRDNWRGILLVRDELAGWIGGFDRYSNGRGGDVAHWLSMHSGEPIIVDRKTSGTIYVPRAHVCIAGGIQPETLRRALGSEHFHNGLAARLFLTMPPLRARKWSKAGLPPEHEAAYALLIERLRELQPQTLQGEPEPVSIRLDNEAEQAWADYFQRHDQQRIELTGALASAWSKLEGGAARLALVVHLARWAAGESVSESHIDGMSMKAGVVLAEWFKAEARRVYAVLRESDHDREVRQWCETIRRKGNSVSVREWQRIRSLRTSDDALAELKRLEAAGRGKVQPKPQTGRGAPSTVFILRSDNTDTDNKPAGDAESAIVSVSEVSESANEGDAE